MAEFECRMDLNATAEQVFDFLRRPANLQMLSPPDTQLVYIQPPELIELGTRLDCKVSAYGMIQQISYEIVELISPQRYREKMVDGPLPLWLQDHIVESNPAGGISLINRIQFEPPAGMLGFIVSERRIIEALEDGFDFRAKELKKVFA